MSADDRAQYVVNRVRNDDATMMGGNNELAGCGRSSSMYHLYSGDWQASAPILGAISLEATSFYTVARGPKLRISSDTPRKTK